jgi:hypothetical protein
MDQSDASRVRSATSRCFKELRVGQRKKVAVSAGVVTRTEAILETRSETSNPHSAAAPCDAADSTSDRLLDGAGVDRAALEQ